MNIQSYDISDALNVPKWETIQNCFAELTNTAISLIDIAGNPVTACSNVSDFCQAVRENIQLDSLCRECDALAGLEAFRNRKPYIFICHCNLVAVAVPIVNGRRYIGAVMIGAFPPNESTFENGVQGISDEVGVTHIGEDRLAGLFQKLSARTYDDIKNISETIRAIIEGLMAQSCKITYGECVACPVNGIGNSPVSPALAYIEKNRNEMINMSEMARLCNMSDSYFSRLFPKVMGETFKKYVNRRKIEWSKEQLINTNDTVEKIAADYGFMNPNYFIRVFKQYCEMTPMEYRREKNKTDLSYVD